MKKFMYSIIIGICLLIFGAGLNAQHQPTHTGYTITWEDSNEKLDGFKWNIFMRDEGGSFDVNAPVLTVLLPDATPGEDGYKAVGSITVTGAPGSRVTKYFVMNAQIGENISGFSNEAMVMFTIPLNAPYGVKVIFNLIGE